MAHHGRLLWVRATLLVARQARAGRHAGDGKRAAGAEQAAGVRPVRSASARVLPGYCHRPGASAGRGGRVAGARPAVAVRRRGRASPGRPGSPKPAPACAASAEVGRAGAGRSPRRHAHICDDPSLRQRTRHESKSSLYTFHAPLTHPGDARRGTTRTQARTHTRSADGRTARTDSRPPTVSRPEPRSNAPDPNQSARTRPPPVRRKALTPAAAPPVSPTGRRWRVPQRRRLHVGEKMSGHCRLGLVQTFSKKNSKVADGEERQKVRRKLRC